MDISDIAEIINGVATFTVAVVLVMQLRKQNQHLKQKILFSSIRQFKFKSIMVV
tara:strand:- start:62 stop:223 length:162 start_codon:yes stop_codon:yes gene_type:complete